MYDKISIGNRIKQSRKAMKMTQDELAERAGYSNRSSIAKTAEIKRQIAEMKKPSTAPVVPAEVSEMLSDKSFADIYNSLSDKEERALWHSVIDHIEFDMDGNITEIFYIH